MTGSHPPFDVHALGDWFWRLRRSAVRIARLADPPGYLSGASYTLGTHLGNPDLVVALGGPRSKIDVSGSQHSPYTEWLHAAWGRRCSYYFSALAQGLLVSGAVFADEDIEHLANRIRESSSNLMREFRRGRRESDTLERALQFRALPFLITYLDATLFSTLVLLKRAEDPDSPNYDELRIGDAEKVRAGLVELIRSEVALYIEGDEGKSDVLVDDSTLWWGVTELIHQDGDRFEIGKYKRRTGAVDLCCRLARWTLDSPAEPDFGMALIEATPEIYSGLRTKMLVIQNALRILQMKWSDAQLARLETPLTNLVTQCLDQVQRYPSNGEPLAEEQAEHAYFSGLGLETASKCVMYLESLGFAVELEEEEVSETGDENEWSEWAPSIKHAKALGIGDHRTFEARAKQNWGLKEHWKNRQSVRFKMSALPPRLRRRYDENFE